MLDIIYYKPNQLQKLYLIDTGFEGSIGDEICAALNQANISTLIFIQLDGHPDWFKSEEQCENWVQAFGNQNEL